MSVDVREYVVDLLKTYPEREWKIALLHYELEHAAHTSGDEMIQAMALGHRDGGGPSDGHISDKTLYIALNYQNKADKLNADLRTEITLQLVTLEQEQRRLNYYVSLLEDRQAAAIRLFYFKGYSQNEVAQELAIVPRTVRRIRDEAVEKLIELYSFTGGLAK